MKRTGEYSGSCVSVTVFFLSALVAMVLGQSLLYLLLKNSPTEYYSLRGLISSGTVKLFWASQLLLFFTLFSPTMSVLRRMFVDMCRDMDLTVTRQFIYSHATMYYSRAYLNSFVLLLLRVTAGIPLLLSGIGVNYFVNILEISRLTSFGLVCLMFCITLTAVTGGLFIRYLISISLAPYMMVLDPRMSIFDACDRSAALMEGKHMLYIRFLLSFIPEMLLMVLVFPFFFFYPFYNVSYVMFVFELLGERGKDKFPGMIKRWKKYQ